MAPAGRIITGHGGQGPDLALSGSPNLDSTCERKGLSTGRLLLLVSVSPPWCRPAAVQPARPARPYQDRCARQALQLAGWVLLILPRPGPAWSPAWSTKTDGPGWSSTSPSDPQPDRGRTLPTTTTLTTSSSQHIQEVSRRARRSHLANERSISTSKGPPPAPAKARLDAMLLLGPCLFPSPPPCSHPFSLTTNC